MENNKELFVKAFMEAERLDNQKIPSEKEIKWEFSEKFEHAMNKLIKKNNRIRIATRRKIRGGLLAAIIAILVLFMGLMSVSAIRTPFVEFVKNVFDQYNELTISEESTPPVETIETEYTLSELPEGYTLDTYQSDEYSVFAIWKNSSGEEIFFFQNILDTELNINNEHNYQELTINGQEAYLNEYEYNSSLVWTNGIYWFRLNVPNELSDDILTMAENIIVKN